MVATALPHPERTLAPTKAAIAEAGSPRSTFPEKANCLPEGDVRGEHANSFYSCRGGEGAPGNEGTDFEDCSARLSLVEEDGRRVKAAARARRPTHPPPRPSEQVRRTEPPCESGKPGVPEHPRAGFELVKFRGTFITQEGLRARGMKRIHGVLSGVAVALVAWVALLGSDVIDRPLVFAVSPADNRRSPAEDPH